MRHLLRVRVNIHQIPSPVYSNVAARGVASVYAARYISDRFLPDKAIDLVDEAASSLRLAQESKPDELETLDREVVTLQIELESLKNETDVFSVERREEVENQLKAKRDEAARLGELWQAGESLATLLSAC